MRLKKILKITIYAFLGMAILVWLINLSMTSYLSKKAKELLLAQSTENYQISVDRVKFSLVDRSITIKDFKLSPKDSVLQRVKDRSIGKNSAQFISSSAIRFKEVDFLKALLDKNYIVSQLEVEDLLIQHLKAREKAKPLKEKSSSGLFHLDSVRFEGIHGLKLGQIMIKSLKIQIIDLNTGELSFENKPFGFDISGMRLDPIGNDYFSLKPIEKDFAIENLYMEMPDKNYRFSLDRLGLDFEQGRVLLQGLSLEPTIDMEKLAETYFYNDDIFSFSIGEISIFNAAMEDEFHTDGLFIDSIVVVDPVIHIFKDKTKPFNKSKRPLLLHHKLKKMDFPFLVPLFMVENGTLRYEEKLPNSSDHMLVSMKEMNLELSNLTSMEKFREEPLYINLQAKFMNEAPFELKVELPLRDDQDTFHFSGRLYPSSFRLYDEAIFPALGIKVLSGNLQNLEFRAEGNSKSSQGTMTMRYKGLKTEVSRLKSEQKSGFLSWSVNQVVHRSNPGVTGKLRVAIMDFERTPYKGLGNYLWKTVESGIINTVSPVGLTVEKLESREQRQLKRENKKKKRD